MAYKEYKVLYVVEGGLGTIFLGASGIPIKKMEAAEPFRRVKFFRHIGYRKG